MKQSEGLNKIMAEKETQTLDTDLGDSKVADIQQVGEQGQGEATPALDTNGTDSSSSSAKTLERASELFDKGSKSIEDGDFVDAVDCLSRSLEIRVAHYGELALECALSYYKYGCALLYKSQEEADPLGNVPKNDPKIVEKDISSKNVKDGESSKAFASNSKEHSCSVNNEDVEDGATEKDQEDDNEGSDDDDEELEEADEDDSDLDLAWKMLDVARAIFDKCPEEKIEKVNILATLGEVSMETEDFETSLIDYKKALSILERLVEPDHRRIVELNFRICLLLEVWPKVEEAIPYCQKAISLCKSRLNRLNEDVKPTALPEIVDPVNDDSGGNQASGKGDADPSIGEDEREMLGGILSELERKLEDLQHVMSNPKNSIFAEIMKMVSSKNSASVETSMPSTESRSSSLNSSNMAVVNVNTNGGGFDSPTLSTAATGGGGGVTHLGVVGRGVKRASLNLVVAEPSSKQLASGSSSCVENDGSSVSQAVNSSAGAAAQDAESDSC